MLSRQATSKGCFRAFEAPHVRPDGEKFPSQGCQGGLHKPSLSKATTFLLDVWRTFRLTDNVPSWHWSTLEVSENLSLLFALSQRVRHPSKYGICSYISPRCFTSFTSSGVRVVLPMCLSCKLDPVLRFSFPQKDTTVPVSKPTGAATLSASKPYTRAGCIPCQDD